MILHVHVHDRRFRLLDAEFKEGDHPRGQPDNSGQFAKQHAAYHAILTKGGFEHQGKGKYQHSNGETAEIGAGHYKTSEWASSPKDTLAERRSDLKRAVAGTNYREDMKRKAAATGPREKGQPLIKMPELDQKQTDAIDAYFETDTGAEINGGKINRALMSGKPLPAEISSVVSAMDDLMKESSTTGNMEVYRGVSKLDISRYVVGATISDPRFTSTSTDEEMADKFSKWQSGNEEGRRTRASERGKFIVTLPKGSHAVDVLGLGSVGGLAREEKEVILPRNQKFKVVKVDHTSRTVHLQAVV